MVEAWQLLKGAEPSRKVNSSVSGPYIGHLFSILKVKQSPAKKKYIYISSSFKPYTCFSGGKMRMWKLSEIVMFWFGYGFLLVW